MSNETLQKTKKQPTKKRSTSKKQVLMSFIVPVYNAEKDLATCLDSLLKQNVDKEIICINDGSTDGSLAILENYAQKNAEIRIVTQRNAGPGAARNRGIKLAKGKYIWFVDADDYLLCENLQEICNIADEQNVEMVRGVMQFKSNGEDMFYLPYAEEIRSGEYRGFTNLAINYFQMGLQLGLAQKVCAGFYASTFLKENKLEFAKTYFAENGLFELATFCAAPKAKVLEIVDVLYFYRENPTGLTHGENTKQKQGLATLSPMLLALVDTQVQATLAIEDKHSEAYSIHKDLVKFLNFAIGDLLYTRI
ncbi:glycosyltransferase family 2 protein [Conservatibacter flavescens]|uniref:Glycosyltransferase 2-like domain-containing protein n=1 Tax=Conservatibacter flavescens TaxID=28161 RepID=A0A2M8S1A1_9PAST|nr:glycosyltransferase [Conservatibacter flavescens]PJG84931.1 hypothetical protein CVP05_08835 [Conservatibacter flavescens]